MDTNNAGHTSIGQEQTKKNLHEWFDSITNLGFVLVLSTFLYNSLQDVPTNRIACDLHRALCHHDACHRISPGVLDLESVLAR